jgi:DNA-directed RNA polymerase specialized sigma24 family protein
VTNSKISDIELNQLIEKAVKGDKEALARLRSSKWLTQLLHNISLRMANAFNQFNLISAEIEDALSDAVCDKIETIRKPNKSSMTAWCWTIGRRISLNKIGRAKLDKKEREKSIQEIAITGTRKTATNISKPLPVTGKDSPEKILLEKEATVLRNNLRTDLYLKVPQELAKLSPEDAKLLISWSGKTLEELKEETGIPISTLSRHLKALQKDILKNLHIYEVVKRDPRHWKGVAELIRNSIKAMTPAA